MTNAVTLASLANSGYLRNRIINGAMMIDQRNAGAAVTLSNSNTYTVDRWAGNKSSDAVITAQQDSNAPAGFKNSIKITITTADTSISASQLNYLIQRIEGLNIADFNWGSANAKPITLSFWIYSSVTGTFGGAFGNSAFNRGYPFTYVINSANTWEYKTVTISGDTTGTWLTTNGVGLDVYFDLGSGSSYTGAAGAWSGAGYVGANGTVQLANTLNATWYLTGVQLEVGTQATPFEWRPYTVELALCQRYYEVGAAGNTLGVFNWSASSQTMSLTYTYRVTKRATPTVAVGWGATLTPTVDCVTSYQGGIGSGSWYYMQGITINAEL